MTHDEDEFLARALGHLPREMSPPAALEESTVRAVRAAGVLRGPARMGLSIASWVLAASVAGIAFVGGSVFATRAGSVARSAARVVVDTLQEPTFALLLYGGGPSDDSATHASRSVEYSEWARTANASARVVGGEALGTAVAAVAMHTVRRGVDSIIVDDPPAESGDFVGYFLVRAPDRAAALALARDCPHLRYGGRVVVRRVWPDSRSVAASTIEDSGRP
jgi:hypothetical protein